MNGAYVQKTEFVRLMHEKRILHTFMQKWKEKSPHFLQKDLNQNANTMFFVWL